MEVVNHQGDSANSQGRLSVNDRVLSDDPILSPTSSRPETDESSQLRIVSSLEIANKFKRIFPPGISEKVSSVASNSALIPNQELNNSSPSPVNVQENINAEDEAPTIGDSSKDSVPMPTKSLSLTDSVDSQDKDPPAVSSGSPLPLNESNSKDGEDESSLGSSVEEVSSSYGKDFTNANSENNDGELRIHMVTTLDSNDIFVEAPSGPMSPVVAMSNPLDSDKEQSTDSVTCDKDLSDKSLSTSLESTSKDYTPADKDNEQGEVITGDRNMSLDDIKKNLNTTSDIIDDNEASSSKSLSNHVPQTSIENRKLVKVIYPKKKPTDIGQIKIISLSNPLIKSCLQCSKVTKCDISIEISGSVCYLCSQECLKLHKTDQINALQRKNCAVVPLSDQQELGIDSRICVNCDTNVTMFPEDKVLSWETMEFCNEDCLSKYQVKMWSFCTLCKKDVSTPSMGKYCVRFGHEVKQFCSSVCLEDFKKGIKVCCYCQKDLSNDEDCFLAPIGEKGQFKDFCSQHCLDEYFSMSHNLPPGFLKVEHCGVCDKNTLIQVQVVTSPETTVNLCSVVCLAAFKFVNTSIFPVPCCMCKKYYDKTIPNTVTVYYEGELLIFCSKSCMNINILSKRKIVACGWCKVKKYNFDMIRRKNPESNSGMSTWCSVNCMAVSSLASNNSRKPCTYCKKLEVPSCHLAMSDRSIRLFCSHLCMNTFQQISFQSSSQSNGIIPTSIIPTSVIPTVSDSAPTMPMIQSVGTLKKPGEIKVISPAAMNGTIQATLLPPVAQQQQPVVQPVQQQFIKHQILVVPQCKPQMVNTMVQAKPNTTNKAITVRVNKSSKASQTDEEEAKAPVLIPIPVPIYIPCPMAMYSVPVPTPVPIPIPVPVPIIIPTTKGTAEEILADIKRIQEQMPGNPYEAELVMMAQMVEGRKQSGEEGTPQEGGRKQKRPVGEMLNEVDGPPEKKQKEDLHENALSTTAHHLTTVSHLPLSLKETLAVSAWKNYAAKSGDSIDLLEMRPAVLAEALKGFISSATIPGGGFYTPDQKYYLMLGIQYYLQENGRLDNIFYDRLMDPFIKALDEEALSFQNLFGESDNIITRVEEEHLWESKQLGPHSPSTLLATLIYFNTKYFNLTTVEEHMEISFKDIMMHWKRSPSAEQPPSSAATAVSVLRYVTPESLRESHPKKKKVYEQEANTEDAYRCPIRLYEFYLSKCPESVKTRNDLFYLSLERSCIPDSPIWYSALPLSQEVIQRSLNRFRMVKEINQVLVSS